MSLLLTVYWPQLVMWPHPTTGRSASTVLLCAQKAESHTTPTLSPFYRRGNPRSQVIRNRAQGQSSMEPIGFQSHQPLQHTADPPIKPDWTSSFTVSIPTLCLISLTQSWCRCQDNAPQLAAEETEVQRKAVSVQAMTKSWKVGQG